MIYLYAITDRPETPLPTLPGLGEATLFSLVYRDISAVVSRLAASDDSSAPMATEANLWQHEAVVEALMTGRAVLPVSFGAVLADEAALQAILATRYTGFVTDLGRVSGRVELSVHVLGDLQIADGEWQTCPEQRRMADSESATDHQPAATGGRAYMMARLEGERQTRVRRLQAEALVADLHARLDGRAVESTHRILITPRILLKAAYLTPRERVADFLAEVENLRLAYPSLRFLCTGPWPPYNFVKNAQTPLQRFEEVLSHIVAGSTLDLDSEAGNGQEDRNAGC